MKRKRMSTVLTLEQRLRNLQSPGRKVDMVLDTDAYNEIDDQFAIAYALHAGEKLDVKALYAAPFFNDRSSGPADGMERSYQEILNLLRLSGVEKPVYRGSLDYLPDEHTFVDSDAARDLCRRAMAYRPEKPLYVVAIGAITNVASALLMKPEIADRIVVVWLGGHSLEWHDNHEFNCMQDVAAARVVFDSGAPLVILPCMGVVSAFTTTGLELAERKERAVRLSGASHGGSGQRIREREGLEPRDLGCDHHRLAAQRAGQSDAGQADSDPDSGI